MVSACGGSGEQRAVVAARRLRRSALHRVSPRSLRRKFTTERQPLLLATSHRSLLAASHSLHKKYTFLLLCHSGNLLTMNTRAFLLIFYVVRVFMRPRPSGPLLGPSDSLFYVNSRGPLNCCAIGRDRSLRLAFHCSSNSDDIESNRLFMQKCLRFNLQ